MPPSPPPSTHLSSSDYTFKVHHQGGSGLHCVLTDIPDSQGRQGGLINWSQNCELEREGKRKTLAVYLIWLSATISRAVNMFCPSPDPL